MFKNISGVTIYVKDEKAKVFIEKQALDCNVLVKNGGEENEYFNINWSI